MRETSCAQVRRRGFWQFVVFGKQMMRDRPKQAASTAQAELALTLTRNSKYAAQIREAWALKPRFPNLQVKVFDAENEQSETIELAAQLARKHAVSAAVLTINNSQTIHVFCRSR